MRSPLAETGAAITAAKVGVVNGTISGKNISATLPFGTDLTEVALNITASKMAKVKSVLTYMTPLIPKLFMT